MPTHDASHLRSRSNCAADRDLFTALPPSLWQATIQQQQATFQQQVLAQLLQMREENRQMKEQNRRLLAGQGLPEGR